MGRLKTAHDKQREYAKKEYLSGDEAKGDEHSAKAEAFLVRILAGEDAETPAGEGEDTTPPAEDEPLSDDMAEAAQQLLERYGLDNTADAAAIIEASGDQGREAAFLGLLGVPGTFPGADYSLFEEYYERTNLSDDGSSSWAPKAEWAASGSGWKHYVQNKA
jgi:hypothetical protein